MLSPALPLLAGLFLMEQESLGLHQYSMPPTQSSTALLNTSESSEDLSKSNSRSSSPRRSSPCPLTGRSLHNMCLIHLYPRPFICLMRSCSPTTLYRFCCSSPLNSALFLSLPSPRTAQACDPPCAQVCHSIDIRTSTFNTLIFEQCHHLISPF